MGEYWQLFSSISNNGEDLAYLQTENLYESVFSRSILENSKLMHATSSGTTKTIDTGIIIRPEISSEGSFIKYQKIEGDELSWYIADTQTSNISYDIPNTEISSYTSGSHEFMFGITFRPSTEKQIMR